MYAIVIAVVAVGIWLFMRKGTSTTALYSESPSPSPSTVVSNVSNPTPTSTPMKTQTLPDGLKIEDEVIGTGPAAKAGQTVSVHYTGWLTDGTKFDSSVDRGQPFSFNLGAGQVIAGWDEGVAGMQVGGNTTQTIPASLGYGASGAGGVIPPNATLIFEVQLLAIK
jgi:FKBP-type peptidyl-prolyl cis-trans isomerase FkpA